MYKKITHTIVEEHFDCPQAVGIASSVGTGTYQYSDSMNDMPMPMKFKIMPAAVKSAEQFKMEVENFLMDTDSRWQNLAKAIFDARVDYEQAIDDVFVSVDYLGDTLKGYYGAEFAERFNQSWRNIAMSLLYIWKNTQGNFDITEQETRLRTLVLSGLAQALSRVNNLWPEAAVNSVLNNLITGYVDLGKAIKAKNANSEAAARTKIMSHLQQLCSTVSSGVIQQFPALFTM